MTTTREEATVLAREAGIQTYFNSGFVDSLIRLIDLAKAKENEACALDCENDGNDLAGLYYAGKIRARMKP